MTSLQPSPLESLCLTPPLFGTASSPHLQAPSFFAYTPASVPSASSPQGTSQVLGTLSPQLCHNSTACWDQPRCANC
ncbi:coiled-coil domain-containing protein 33 [Lates japonicus]|uniref:Coiled-coil domain-containing protein 33 n=1 Tax=Lates japonicus TaxID=270547 RepID=A0AAD3MS46_LATJO|nr:coiled-coil domain-containing protein 33 [Lates japonicus]